MFGVGTGILRLEEQINLCIIYGIERKQETFLSFVICLYCVVLTLLFLYSSSEEYLAIFIVQKLTKLLHLVKVYQRTKNIFIFTLKKSFFSKF